jgi:exonuclease SbcC
MRLRALDLRNFRRFEKESVEFGEGVIGVLGPNGAGKSTLVEALGWALFGSDAVQVMRTGKEDLRRAGAGPSEALSVVLEFEHDGVHYTVSREMRAKGTVDARLVADGKEIGAGTSAVTEAVRAAIGMDHETFFASVFSCQRDLDALADATPAVREGMFMKMLGIERVDRALEAVRESKRAEEAGLRTVDSIAAQAEAEDLPSRRAAVEGAIVSIKKRQEEAGRDLADEEAALEKAQVEQEEHERRRAAAASAQEDVRALEERLAAAEARAGALDAEVKETRQRAAQAEALEPRAKEYDTLAKEREATDVLRERHLRRGSLLEEKERIGKELGAARSRLSSLRSEAHDDEALEREEDERAAKESEARKERDASERARAEASGEAEALGRQKRDEEAHLADVRKRGEKGVCPTCERPLGQEHRQLEERLAEKVKELSKRVKEAEGRARESGEKGERASKLLAALEKKRKSIEAQKLKATSSRSALAELERQAERLGKRSTECEREIEGIGEVEFSEPKHRKLLDSLRMAEGARAEWLKLSEAAGRLPRMEKDLAKAKDEAVSAAEGLKEARTRLAATGFSPAAAEKAKNAVRDALARARAAREALGMIEKEMVRAENELKMLELRIAELEKLRERAKETRARFEEMVELEGLVKEFRGWLVSKVRPYVSDVASELFSQVTDGRYSRLELDEKYEPRILDGGKLYPLGRFSGGERDLASLCIRLAVARLLFDRSGSEINLLVLDEIFGSQDPERRRRVMHALSRLSTTFRQILLITHIDDVKEGVDSVIRVERGEEGSRVVVE